ncbi:MAG: TonB-dependent receptor [Bacteroidaceae bacterium]|nr:TonB-dependent receptor [Bacteroidaceae bacterium]
MGNLSQKIKTSLFGKVCMIAFMLLTLSWTGLNAKTVKGKVVGPDQEPLIGATVTVSGTQNATVTDYDGNFSIEAADGQTLVVSYIGYVTKQVKVVGNNVVITLETDNAALDEVVVVGYGTMKRSDLTGSVVTVNTDDMLKKTPVNVSQGLQGAAPGVIVTMQDGSPDAKAQIRIRGVATINGSAAPLYVVDGIQVGTNADFIAPSDIETIDILKDASATAIYGSAGANGVIMITTKHGKKGHSAVNVAADFGIATLPYHLDVCSVDQYAANLRQARVNDGQVDKSGNAIMWNPIWTAAYDGKRKAIDWQDQMTRAALRQNYSVSTSGGNDKSQYNASIGFLRNEGLVINSDYQRITARANANTQINDYLGFGVDVNFIHSDSHGSNTSVGNFGNLSSLRDYAFACPSMDFITSENITYAGVPAGTHVSPNVVNPDGTYGEVPGGKNFNDGFWGTTLGNMYAKQMENNPRNRTNRALASAYMTIKPVKGLEWKTLVSYDYNSNSSNNFTGGIYTQRFNIVNGQYINLINGLAGGGGVGDAYYAPRNGNEYEFNLSNGESQTLDIQNTLTYNWSNDIHNLTVMLGNEVSRRYGQWASARALGFESPDNRDIGLTTKPTERTGSGSLNLEVHNISYFGRINYSLMDRYLFTATVRRDGSSNFGTGNRWGTFPSVAAGWRVSEEPFMQNQNVVSNLKLRAGWGQTGNSGGETDLAVTGLNVDGMYVYYNQGAAMGLGTGTPNVIKGYYPVLKDTNLKWETNEQLNIGVDAGFLNGELNVSIDYFVRKSKDLLLYRQIRATSGYDQIYTNYGEIENKGLEFMASYNHRVNKDFSFSATLTGSTLTNKVNKMGDDVFNTNSDSSSNANPTGDGSNTGAVGAADGYHWGNHSICREGEAVGSFYGYRVEKIITTQADLDKAHAQGQTAAKMGDYLYKDIAGKKATQEDVDKGLAKKVGDDLGADGVLNESDMDILGNGFPALNYGLTLGAQYKNFDFSVQMHGVLGQKIFSYSAMRLSNMFSSDDGCTPNILAEAAKNAWSPSNPNGTEARLSIIDENYNMRASDAWVKNGNFLKISNLQVGYTLPKTIAKKCMIQNARIYVAIQNLLCISPYNKYGDPECGQGSVLYTGLDTGRYPMPRTYAAGINVTF